MQLQFEYGHGFMTANLPDTTDVFIPGETVPDPPCLPQDWDSLYRATLDSMAYQTKDVLGAMEADSGIKLAALKVDGGAVANNMLMQFQADILGVPVDRPQVIETTALGAAYLAGLAVGVWDSKEELVSSWKLQNRFEPTMEPEKAAGYYKGWRKAVKHAMHWLSDED